MKRKLNGYNGQGRAPQTDAKIAVAKEAKNDVAYWMDQNSGNWPLAGRLLTIDDVIERLPARMAGGHGISQKVAAALRADFGGVNLGRVRLSKDDNRVELWTINDMPIAALGNRKNKLLVTRSNDVLVKLYESDKAANRGADDVDDFDDADVVPVVDAPAMVAADANPWD